MEKKQVFISYKSEEFDEALWVKTALEQQGISCWMAPMCITGGASYAAEIPAAINNCTVFVLILSEKVQTSKWVPRELDQAINAGKTIMPFMLEDCPLKDEFKFYLSNIQRYSAYQGKQKTMDVMSREIRNILGIPDPVVEEPLEEKPAAEEPVKQEKPKKLPKAKPPKKKKPVLPLIIGGAVAAFLLPVVLIIIGISGSKATFAGTKIDKDAYTLRVENQTVTASDLMVLEQFSELHQVCLTNCVIQATDLSAFSEHPLWGLELEGCELTDAQLQSIDFEALERLSDLDLSNNPQLTDLKVISPVADTLTDLSIGNTGITSLEALESCTQLTDLYIENLGLESLESLRLAVYLETLVADGNQLESLSGLENTSVLQKVSLKSNQLKNVDCLANSAATLKRLYLEDNSLQDLSCLSGCTSIIECSADRNQLTSMDWAGNWTELIRLSVSENLLSGSVATPPKSENLVFLDLSENQLTGFQNFVLNSNSYLTLDLSNNQLTSLDLPSDRKYDLLALHGNPLTSLSFAEGSTGLHMTVDYFEALDTVAVQNNSFNNLYIVDCPPNRIVELEQASSAVALLSREDVEMQIPDPEFPEY